MFRPRRLFTALIALAILPLVGCSSWRCCKNTSSCSSRPAYYSAPAPACSSCGSGTGAPVIMGQ